MAYAKLISQKYNWLFNCVYQQNAFTNQILDIYVKAGFDIK